MIPSLGPMEYPYPNKWWEKPNLPFAHLKLWKCSLNPITKDLPVCPIYFILQSGQVSWKIPHLLNLYILIPLFNFNSFPMVIFSSKDILRLVFLNNSLPIQFIYLSMQILPFCLRSGLLTLRVLIPSSLKLLV